MVVKRIILIMINYFGETADRRRQCIKPFQPNVAFHIDTSHLICNANKMTGFYKECNNERKCVKPYIQPESLSEFLAITNLRNAASRV